MSALTDEPDERNRTTPRPSDVRGACTAVFTALPSQFRKVELMGTGPVAAAIPVPSVSVAAPSTVKVETAVPNPVITRI
ncbi:MULTISPECIES: hypothetical protein [unclassified Mycobacterium]|uniref:hypothetical protein n=1 Tax=unclassified Mycobacterium TaxID=2642494 RepID=UPI0027424816|nr:MULTISPECIES: hypothetical protein [unclassified Mycobacterium]MDP7706233.1 hypothetical protein [Mycobacterium sp. TY815]MDP7725997.1 hypothetical protein [Mycobacterium sp. TY814]